MAKVLPKDGERMQDGVRYVRVGEDVWEEVLPATRGATGKKYPLKPCHLCDRLVSTAGWAWSNHQAMHAREKEEAA